MGKAAQSRPLSEVLDPLGLLLNLQGILLFQLLGHVEKGALEGKGPALSLENVTFSEPPPPHL